MDKKVTDTHLAEIAKFLPKWKVVAKRLGLEGEMVRDIEDRYRDGEDQRLEALMKWVGKDGPQATYGKIYDVLRDMEEGEAAEKVEELTRGKAFFSDECVLYTCKMSTSKHTHTYTCTHINSHTHLPTSTKAPTLHHSFQPMHNWRENN